MNEDENTSSFSTIIYV